MEHDISYSFLILNGTLCNEVLWSSCLNIFHTKIPTLQCMFPPIDDGTSIENIAKNIIQQYVLPDKNQTWIIGYSLGGIVALECIRQQQKNIAGVILISTNPEGQTQERTQIVNRQLQCLNAKGLEAVFDEILLPAYFGEMQISIQEHAKTIKSMGLRLGTETLKKQLATLITRIDQRPYLSYIHIPTLLICGSNDTVCHPTLHKIMNHLIPNSTLTIFEGIGHMLPLLAPQQLAETIVHWITKQYRKVTNKK